MKSWIGICTVASTMAIAAAGMGIEDKDLSSMRGSIAIDGSSTVYPITEAVAEEFAETAPKVRVSVGISGTGVVSSGSAPVKRTSVTHRVRSKARNTSSPRKARSSSSKCQWPTTD